MNETIPERARQLHKYIANRLKENYEEKEAENIARTLMLDLLQINPNHLPLNERIALSDIANKKLQESIDRLLSHEPIQYICGVAHFFGRMFKVTKDVLIPRPETEELVQWIIETGLTKPSVLDVGTGSGCIAVTLALEVKGSVIDAIEVSQAAIAIALENSESNKATVNILHNDLLKMNKLPRAYDIIVSNPPYIPQCEIAQIDKNVKDHEPHVALFVEDDDPLIFYRKIASLAKTSLRVGGYLFFEMHEAKNVEIKQMLMHLGYDSIEIKKDLQGKPRMLRAQIGSHT